MGVVSASIGKARQSVLHVFVLSIVQRRLPLLRCACVDGVGGEKAVPKQLTSHVSLPGDLLVVCWRGSLRTRRRTKRLFFLC